MHPEIFFKSLVPSQAADSAFGEREHEVASGQWDGRFLQQLSSSAILSPSVFHKFTSSRSAGKLQAMKLHYSVMK